MTCFDYPIETKYLLRKKRQLKKELLAQQRDWIDKRIAVLGGSTTNEIAEQLELFLLHFGIRATFYQSEYGQYWQDALFGNAVLDGFHPDIIYIHTNWRNVEKFPSVKDSVADVDKMLNAEFERFSTMWDRLFSRIGCPVIQNNFDRPDYRLLGNRDIWDARGRSNYLANLNQRFYGYAQQHKDFYINDLEYLSADYGLSQWADPLYWHMYKYAMCLDAIPHLAASVANIIKSIYGKNKKALSLDLDNTLWGGVIGDDGVEGIALGPELPKGQVYTEFQKYCKALSQIGVVLTVNSKNERENALAGLNHPYSVLKPEDFVDIKANWNPKDQNLLETANELTLGADSFVFADDNPVERELVKAQIPGIGVPLLDSPENYIRVLDHSGFFEVTTLSAEDLDKTKLYHAKLEAAKAASSFENYDEYLDSLNMTAYIEPFMPLHIQRIAQLTNKSNQFNLTTLRCSEDDIKAMQADPRFICLSGRLVDKFADNGIVSVTAGEQKGDELHVRLWLMSCRVLKRGMEYAMMNALVEIACSRGIKRIIGHYYPTAKNNMVRQFFGSMQFEKISEDTDGSGTWLLNTVDYKKADVHMKVIISEDQ